MENITIATATPEMAEVCSELAVLAGPELLPAIFGPNARLFWRKAFAHKKCCFSYQHSTYIRANGAVVGLAIMYDAMDRKSEGLRSLLIILRYLKLSLFRQLPALWQSGEILAQVQKKDCYLSNLAIYPQYRSLCYGTKLMRAIEQQAKEAGSKRMVLDTETDNDRAVQFYRRIGYEIEAKTPILKTRGVLSYVQEVVITSKYSGQINGSSAYLNRMLHMTAGSEA